MVVTGKGRLCGLSVSEMPAQRLDMKWQRGIKVENSGRKCEASLKYQLFNMENQTVLAKGICECMKKGKLIHKTGHDHHIDTDLPTHDEAINLV